MTKSLDADTNTKRESEVCSWCGARFTPDAPQNRPVCARCQRLLKSAGLKDEEIFGYDDQHDEGQSEL